MPKWTRNLFVCCGVTCRQAVESGHSCIPCGLPVGKACVQQSLFTDCQNMPNMNESIAQSLDKTREVVVSERWLLFQPAQPITDQSGS